MIHGEIGLLTHAIISLTWVAFRAQCSSVVQTLHETEASLFTQFPINIAEEHVCTDMYECCIPLNVTLSH